MKKYSFRFYVLSFMALCSLLFAPSLLYAGGACSTDINVTLTGLSGYEPSLGNPSVTGYCLKSTDAGVRSWGTCGSGGDNLGSALYSDVVSLWTTCSGYLKSDGTCDTPSGGGTECSTSPCDLDSGTTIGSSSILTTTGDGSGLTGVADSRYTTSITVQTVSSCGTAYTWDTTLGDQINITLDNASPCVLTVTGATVGHFYYMSLIQSGSTRLITFPSTFKWESATAPTLSTTTGYIDEIACRYRATDFFLCGFLKDMR